MKKFTIFTTMFVVLSFLGTNAEASSLIASNEVMPASSEDIQFFDKMIPAQKNESLSNPARSAIAAEAHKLHKGHVISHAPVGIHGSAHGGAQSSSDDGHAPGSMGDSGFSGGSVGGAGAPQLGGGSGNSIQQNGVHGDNGGSQGNGNGHSHGGGH